MDGASTRNVSGGTAPLQLHFNLTRRDRLEGAEIGQMDRKSRCPADDQRRILGEELCLVGPSRDRDRIEPFLFRHGGFFSAACRDDQPHTSGLTTLSRPYRVSNSALERDLRHTRGEPHLDGADTRPCGSTVGIEQLENADFAFRIGHFGDAREVVGRRGADVGGADRILTKLDDLRRGGRPAP